MEYINSYYMVFLFYLNLIENFVQINATLMQNILKKVLILRIILYNISMTSWTMNWGFLKLEVKNKALRP
jgi:hypothetical protein